MAKNNEAKIKFIAETGEFNEQIKDAEGSLKELRSELKLNSTQMKGAGETAELLKDRHNALQKELDASRKKTEALTKKVEAAERIFGENSDEAKRLRTQLNNAKNAEEAISNEIKDVNKKLKEQAQGFEEAGDSAKKASDGFTVMGGAAAELAADAIQGAINKVGEFIDYLVELPEATREIRQDMATLDTSFERSGFTVEQAKNTWRELYNVFGEDDRAVEAANLIAKMSKDQEDLNSWVTITRGVWGTYQDSLPVEGLAEASNETAKTGKVTGVLADALNWSGEAATMFADYMSEDVTTAEDAFNEALKKCTTEEERQALITETLTKLYGDASTKYQEASGSQIAAKDATAENILVQNELADTIEPLTTTWQGMKNEMLQGILPAVGKFTEWGIGALNWMKEHPVAMRVIVAVLTGFAVAVGALAIAWGVYQVAQWAANASMLGCPLTWIVLAIAAVVAAIILLISYWDEVVAAVKRCVNWVVQAWGTCTSWLNSNVIQPIANFFKNLWTGVKNAFGSAGEWIKTKWSGITSWFSQKIASIKNTFATVKNAILSPFRTAIDKVKGLFNKLKLKFPNIKLPHFSVTPKGWKIGDLLKGSIPKLGIKWYAKGGIMTKPTVFGMNGNNAMVGGEDGPEAILPINRLQDYISEAINKDAQNADLQRLAYSIDKLANRPVQLNVNGRNFATATAGDTDSVNGFRSILLERGLAL